MSKREFDIVVEQRIGVVMYGGISLAIYMNGVAQEFLNLVLSTAHDREGNGLLSEQPSLNGDTPDMLTGIQRVYRDMARMISSTDDGTIQTKFVVDILTGTSAGGLNAMYLGKSIAEKVSLKPLQSLWVQEGDISILLNDKASYKGLFGMQQRPARSLLNSRRMYAKLVAAFAQMENQPLFKSDTKGVGLCTELDVYMTATDLQGKASPVYLGALDFTPHVSHENIGKPNSKSGNSGGSEPSRSHEAQFQRFQLEAEHRAVFHFRYESDDYLKSLTGNIHISQKNDFAHDYVPFLAFVGRCTSSIVPAFEPMRLIDTKDVLEKTGLPFSYKPKEWTNLYRQYWRETPLYFPGKSAPDVIAEAQQSFEIRTFGDGGYLDNKPFGYAFKELANRRADVAVRRNVFYVEPHPDDNQKTLDETTNLPDKVQDVLEHAKLALTLPGVQTINERVMAIRDEGEYADRVRRAVDAAKHSADDDIVNRNIASSINLENTVDMLAEVLVEMLGFDPDTAVKPALRHLLYASLEILNDGDSELAQKSEDILKRFDLKRARRKVEWLRVNLERGILRTAYADQTTKKDLADAEKQRSQSKELGREFFHLTNPALVFHKVIQVLDMIRQGDIAPLELEQRGANSEVSKIQVLQNVASGKEEKPKAESLIANLTDAERSLVFGLLELRVSLDELVFVMAAKRSANPSDGGRGVKTKRDVGGIDGARRDRARQVLGGSDGFSRSVVERMTPDDRAVRERRPTIVKRIFDAVESILDLEALNERIRSWAGDDLIAVFEREDNFVFPLLYPAGLGDSYALDITRISPKDAGSLESDESKRVEKLSGVSLAHFGAFFTRSGRIMDIIWGRLNTAEILLNTYLDSTAVDKLLPKAQLSILGESLVEFATEIQIDDLASRARGHISLRRRLENLVGFVVAKSKDVTIGSLGEENYLTKDQTEALARFSREFEGGDTLAGESPDNETMWQISPRATQVLAQILDESIASKPWFKWPQLIFMYAGRILMLLVEATVPQRPFYRAIIYWYQILFTVAAMTFVLSQIGIWPAAGAPSGKLLLVLIVLWMVTAMIRKWLYRMFKIWADATCVITLLVAGLNLLIGFSVFNVKLFSPGDDVHAEAVWLLSALLVLAVVAARVGMWIYDKWNNALGKKPSKPIQWIQSAAKTWLVQAFGKLVAGAVLALYLLVTVTLAGWISVNTWQEKKMAVATSGTPIVSRSESSSDQEREESAKPSARPPVPETGAKPGPTKSKSKPKNTSEYGYKTESLISGSGSEGGSWSDVTTSGTANAGRNAESTNNPERVPDSEKKEMTTPASDSNLRKLNQSVSAAIQRVWKNLFPASKQ